MSDNAREKTAAQIQVDAAPIEVADVKAETRPQDDVTQSVENRRKLFTKRGSSVNEVFASIRVNAFPPLTRRAPSRELEATEEAAAEDGNSVLLASGIFMITIPVIFAVLSIIPIFWCLRIDGKVSWSWAVTFIPLWIFVGFYYLALCCGLCFSNTSGDQTTPPASTRLKAYTLLKSVLLLVTLVFIPQKLDGDIDWSLVHVLTPYFGGFQVIYILIDFSFATLP